MFGGVTDWETCFSLALIDADIRPEIHFHRSICQLLLDVNQNPLFPDSVNRGMTDLDSFGALTTETNVIDYVIGLVHCFTG